MKLAGSLTLVTLISGCGGPAIKGGEPKLDLPKYRNSLGMTFVKVPGGTFTMGKEGEEDSPAHRVRMSSFWISQYETTNFQFEKLVKHKRSPNGPGRSDPVGGVTEKQLEEFIAKLSKRDGVKYDLPTEAQWEYAARAGSVGTDYPWGNHPREDKFLMGGLRAKPVGSYPPNAFGLYDMIGNFAEIAREKWYEYEVSKEAKLDPVGILGDDERIVRGLGVSLALPMVWYRTSTFLSSEVKLYGFRLVIIGEPPLVEKDGKDG